MSFFDRRYYAVNKLLMSRIGIWPEQSKRVKSIWPLTIFVIVLSLVGPQLVRMHEVQGDSDVIITNIPQLMATAINFTTVLNSLIKSGKMKVMLQKIEMHWKTLMNTPAVIVLEEYAERGRFLTAIYAKSIYITLVIYLFVPIVPIILDTVVPLNETRPRDVLHEVEYGVDRERYFWPILLHGYIVVILSISIFVAIDTMYIMWVQHACGLFEVVGFQLKTSIVEYISGMKNAVMIKNESNYQKMCDCIFFHNEALSFANMIENTYSASLVMVIGSSTIVMSVTGLQTMINLDQPDIMFQAATFTLAQAFRLYLSNVPGQKLIDHSLRVHEFAYDFDWYNMPLKAQRLLILIMIRSMRPCLLTAGKIYVLSMESFSLIIRTALSYSMVFIQLY